MIIDCIGCLHGARPKLEGGDLLIVTGDLTFSDKPDQYLEFNTWLSKQDYRKKIVIAGNHDMLAEKGVDCEVNPRVIQRIVPILADKAIYLQDSAHEFEGLKIYGIPWTHRFVGINPKCCSFTYLDEIWFYDEKVSKIPHDTDILITHGPAFGILDGITQGDALFHVGSKALYNWLKYVERPRLHVFSHIHEAYGQMEHFPTYDDKMMISVNCSIMNECYDPVNKPIRIIF